MLNDLIDAKTAPCHMFPARGPERSAKLSPRYTTRLDDLMRVANSGLLGAFRIQRDTVRSDMSKPSILSSP
jgi:hypothetical protein